MGKSTIFMAISNSYVSLPEDIWWWNLPFLCWDFWDYYVGWKYSHQPLVTLEFNSGRLPCDTSAWCRVAMVTAKGVVKEPPILSLLGFEASSFSSQALSCLFQITQSNHPKSFKFLLVLKPPQVTTRTTPAWVCLNSSCTAARAEGATSFTSRARCTATSKPL